MFDYIFLGILQGIFEWLPVSSLGIVAFFSQFLVPKINPIDFALFLHLGTLFSVLIYFKKDWQEIFALKNKKLLHFLIISTIVSLIIGWPIYKKIKEIAVGNTLLIVMGLGLIFTAFLQRKKVEIKISFEKLAFLSGFFQGLAVIPGISRSAATIFALSLGKLSPSEILKISYMMSAPVVLIVCFYLFFENPILIPKALLSSFFSFLIGLGVLHFLLKLATRINFFKFCLIFGILSLLGGTLGFFH